MGQLTQEICFNKCFNPTDILTNEVFTFKKALDDKCQTTTASKRNAV